MKIFISHAGHDKKIVKMFCDLLIQDLQINENEIFCSSLDSSIRPGDEFNIEIKENLLNSEVILLLITPSYMKSKYCIIEMGMAWANKNNSIPIIIPPLNCNILDGTPMQTRQAIILDDDKTIFNKFYNSTLVDKKIINRLDNEQENKFRNKAKKFVKKAQEYIKENYEIISNNINYGQDISNDEQFSLYIDAQINAIKKAKKRIYISMDSLNPESTDSKLVEFDKLLENAKNDGITVRIITRTGTEPERSRGAYDMCVQHDLVKHIKFSGILNAKALRCTLIDDEEIIISCSKRINKGFSKKYIHFYNEKVNEILRTYIDKEYNRDIALTYKKFIYNRLEEMGVISKETSIKSASEILDIPESSLIKVLDENDP